MMETTTVTIRLPKEVGIELAKKAKSRGRKSSDLAAELVSDGLKKNASRQKPLAASPVSAAKLVDQTFGQPGLVNRKELISLAEDEEFSGY